MHKASHRLALQTLYVRPRKIVQKLTEEIRMRKDLPPQDKKRLLFSKQNKCYSIVRGKGQRLMMALRWPANRNLNRNKQVVQK